MEHDIRKMKGTETHHICTFESRWICQQNFTRTFEPGSQEHKTVARKNFSVLSKHYEDFVIKTKSLEIGSQQCSINLCFLLCFGSKHVTTKNLFLEGLCVG